MIKNFWNWLVTSSADPEKTSLLIKGVMTIGAGKLLSVLTALCGLGLLCLGIDATWLQQAIDILTQLSLGALYILGAGIAAWGMGRKVKLGRWSAPTR